MISPNLYNQIESRIVTMRGHGVMLDADLAALYGVATKVLVQAVKRNIARFPDDFMFQLSTVEWEGLRSQFVTSKGGRGGRRYPPYAFTEHGVAMLSSVLGTEQAILINIGIIRTFVRLRAAVATNAEVVRRLDALESKADVLASNHDALVTETSVQFKRILDAMRTLMMPPESVKHRPIGFVTPEDGAK